MLKTAIVSACLGIALAPANATEIAAVKKSAPLDAGACAPGFVHRGARATDTVCVMPEAHDRTVQENTDAPGRVDPQGAYGPLSCKSGYVWRAAFEGDATCVTPDVRQLVQEENRLGPERTLAFQADASALPVGPWLCGEETIDAVAKVRSGHVIDVEGRVWAYGYGRSAAQLPFVWRKDEKAAATVDELAKRYAGATRAGRDIAIEEIAPHLPLIEEAAKTEATATDQIDTMTNGIVRLYCLIADKANGPYREVVLEQRGALVRINPSPAASELKAWFQPHFWIID